MQGRKSSPPQALVASDLPLGNFTHLAVHQWCSYGQSRRKSEISCLLRGSAWPVCLQPKKGSNMVGKPSKNEKMIKNQNPPQTGYDGCDSVVTFQKISSG